MDAAASTSGSIRKNLGEDQNFYQVPSNLYEFIKELGCRRTIIVKEPNLLNFRKYKAESNDSKFFCCECYSKYGAKLYAYFSYGILRAPRVHSCEATPISELLKKVKTEEANPESSGSSSKSTAIRFDNPLWNGENSEAIFSEDLEENRP
uniref:Uncharacterized protein n=1 Tax=Panagrolaimus superbus TaxID=310955 RepID=A0A914XVZ1_9BILA